jgi:anaerobic dimethyl sulfoxide reductase subunit B
MHCISFIKEKCIQCHGCETACKSWRAVETGVALRKVGNVWLGAYPNVRSEPVMIACTHCEDPACVEACPTGAIEKRKEDGVVVVNQDACTGCRSCFDACPIHAPQFVSDGTMQICDLCLDHIDFDSEAPPCVVTCPTRALQFG